MSTHTPLISAFAIGDTRIDLDHAELVFSDSSRAPLGVPAYVTLKDRRLRLHLRESAPLKLPSAVLSAFAKDARGKVITEKDHLTIEAITDNGLPVRLEEVHPYFSSSPKQYVNGGGTVTHRQLGFHRLSLLAIGQESLNADELRASATCPEDKEESFFARLPSVKLRLLNGGVSQTTKHPYHRGEGFSGTTQCYSGKMLQGEFCLEQTDEGDLTVSYRRQIPTDPTAPSLSTISQAFFAAVGLLHSCNPWPYYYGQWQGRRLVEKWLKAPADCQRDCLEPLAIGIRHENAAALFQKAAEFFAAGGADADYYRQALWLMREACRKGAPMEIRLIALCSILEGLHKRNFSGGETKRECWQRSFAKSGICWDEKFDAMFDSWEFYRNKLAHGFDPHPESESRPTWSSTPTPASPPASTSSWPNAWASPAPSGARNWKATPSSPSRRHRLPREAKISRRAGRLFFRALSCPFVGIPRT